jgi:molecular chaperone GrpE (heat shock protein)
LESHPAAGVTADEGELAAWKEQAKQLQRRLDFLTQELEESVQRMSHSNDVQIVELRQELVRQQKTLEAWDELVIDYLDGIQRALDHPQVSGEAAEVWSRASAQMLNLAKRLGLDEIRPTPGDALIGSQHRIEALVAPTTEFGSGVVTRLIQPGYRRGDVVIRQAKVEFASEKA